MKTLDCENTYLGFVNAHIRSRCKIYSSPVFEVGPTSLRGWITG
jgi:hypothetical protein